MGKIKAGRRLKWAGGLRNRQIAQSWARARPTVTEYRGRAAAVGVAGPLPADRDEGAWEHLLVPPRSAVPGAPRPVPDWAAVHQDLNRKGVVVWLLGQEDKAGHPPGYPDSWFCPPYPAWAAKVDLVRRQDQRAGETLFGASAGQPVPRQDPVSGEGRPAQSGVAVLGARSDTCAEATWPQSLPDWSGAHVRACPVFGGGPELRGPEKLKRGLTQAQRSEPDRPPTCQERAAP